MIDLNCKNIYLLFFGGKYKLRWILRGNYSIRHKNKLFVTNSTGYSSKILCLPLVLLLDGGKDIIFVQQPDERSELFIIMISGIPVLSYI